MSTINVLIADDIATTREDIKRLLYFEEDIHVIRRLPTVKKL